MTLTDPIFGQILGPSDVEFAALNTIEAWTPYMLRVLERRHGYPAGTLVEPPGTTSYTGGIDFDTWTEDLLPMVIVVVQPNGDAERSMLGYSQWYEIEAAAVVARETEEEARIHAGHLATAVMAAITQHGDLGGLASSTDLVTGPTLEFPEPQTRTIVRARVTVRSYITSIVDPLAGTHTDTPPESPHTPDDPDDEFGDWPDHLSTHVDIRDINDEAPDAPTGDRAGANTSVVFSAETAAIGESGTYRVRTDTRVIRFTLGCTEAPEGSDLTVQALRNGDVLATRTIQAGTTFDQIATLNTPVQTGDLLSMNTTSVGSTSAAEGVTAQIDLGS